MGMILTLFLISANVYNSVEAPDDSGFSYIDIWMVGTQFPILLALCQYGFVLHLKKIDKNVFKNPANKKRKVSSTIPSELEILDLVEPQPYLDERIKKLDYGTMIFSLVYFIIFVLLYLTVL